MGRRRMLGRNKQTAESSYIDSTGILYGFSFRQLKSEATLSIRQYLSDGVTFQDVGFVNGYLDTNAVTTFAAGTQTRFELYNQFNDVLTYKKFSSSALPSITDLSGNLYLNNGKVEGVNPRLVISGSVFPATVNSFQVNRGGNNTLYMLNSSPSSKWLGTMQQSSTDVNVSNLAGTPTYWKNKVQVTPINRGILYNELSNVHSQHTVKNAGISGWTSIVKGYADNTNFIALPFMQEELWFDASLMSAQQITDLEQNQMDYYL